MPRQDAADILRFAAVQHAIGDIILAAARETGVADKYAQRMRAAVVDRIAEGSPVPPAIKLVESIRDCLAPIEGDDVRPLLLQVAGYLTLVAKGLDASKGEASTLVDKIGKAVGT